MEYKEFPILDVARRCGLRINDRTLGRPEVEASCPFCGDKPRKYHLFLNTEKNVFKCYFCGERGNSVSLYARLNGISNREAVEDLSGGSNVYRLPDKPRAPAPVDRQPKPIAARHDVYYDMLEHLPLSDRHRADLRARGLSDERIERNMYRSMPVSENSRRLLARMLSAFHDLEGIPGFYIVKPGVWSLHGANGLLIPVCNREGYIQGFQIRLDNEANPKRKYRWLSSRYKEHGTRSQSWIHVTGDTSAKTAYLTEGGLKGDIASYYSDDSLFICVSGINALEYLGDTLLGLDVEELVIAMDMDKIYKPNVQKAVEEIVGIVRSIKGMRVRARNWNPGLKGIDDYYHAVGTGAYLEKPIQPSGITDYLHSLWAKEFPGQDREPLSLCEWEERVVPIETLAVRALESMKSAELSKVDHYLEIIRHNSNEVPPLVSINRDVVDIQDGACRYWAYRKAGYTEVRVYQNKPCVAA